MNSDDRQSVDALIEEAARWHARIDCGTADLDAFEAWRAADPRHAAAFARIVGAVGQVDDLRPALRAKLSLDTRRDVWRGAAAAGLALAMGGGAFVLANGGKARAQTAVGGLSQRMLPDGSRLSLNTDSQVSWRIDGRHGDIWLERGEIALSVPEGAKALILHGADQSVEARACALNARLRGGALDLLVLKGSVTVHPKKAGGRSPKATAVVKGEAILASPAALRVRAMSSDEVQFVSAWQRGEVVFSGETLGAAVGEYNRYLTKKISIGDPSLEAIRLGGRFDNRDPEAFLAALHEAFAINANHTADGSVVLTR